MGAFLFIPHLMFFETGSLAQHGAFYEPRALCVGRMCGQRIPQGSSPALGLQCTLPDPSFMWDLRVPTGVLMLVGQEIHPQMHLPAP